MEYLVKNVANLKLNDILYFYNNIYDYKKNKIDKYINDKSKILSIEGEILLDTLLKDNYSIDYKDIEIKVNNNGKPLITNNNIFFNISHSFDYVITCISNNSIGVDIEKIRKTNINVIDQFATNKEKEYILSTNFDREKRLFSIYTLKEAYIKCKGLSLKNIKDVEFIIDNEKILCSDNTVEGKIITDIKNYIIALVEEK